MSTMDTDLAAYLDGELDSAEAAALERELGQNPEAMRDLLAMIRADRAAQGYFHGIDSRPLPAGVLNVLERFAGDETPAGEDTVVPFDTPAVSGQSPHRPAWHLPLAASVALTIGVGGGLTLSPSPTGTSAELVLEQSDGFIAAGHPLYGALETTASGQTVALNNDVSHFATPVRTVVTPNGNFCREFELSGPRTLSRGAACRQASGSWVITVQSTAPVSNEDGTFRTASDAAAPLIEAYFGEFEPVEEARETQMLKNGWETQ